MLLTLRKVSDAVTAPTITRIRRATTSPRFLPTEPDMNRWKPDLPASAGAVVASTVTAWDGVWSLTRQFLS